MTDAEKPAAPREPATIEQEMEVTRDRLAGTIDQLVHRANPKIIAGREIADVKAFFVDARGKPRTDNIAKVVGGLAGFVVIMLVIRKVAS